MEQRKTKTRIIFENMDFGIDKASGGGLYRFSQRQLYYVIRPFVMEQRGEELTYNNFEKAITKYEAEQGDIAGMYRDPRGILYHPHTGEEIPLGTLSVEKYERPEWTFNKILYIEKEGFLTVLKESKWAEKNDCALLTSKGFASRAARDVLDLLAETGEEIQFYCVHDADAAGSMIYQTLQEGTKARQGRKVKVINLGLDPQEGIDMGLEVENKQSNKREPVADYLAEWGEWLQTHRIELNAMTSPQFLEWITRKMQEHGAVGKVIPPDEVLTEKLEKDIIFRLKWNVEEEMQEEIEKRTQEKYEELLPDIEKNMQGLQEEVKRQLAEKPIIQWSAAVNKIAYEISKI